MKNGAQSRGDGSTYRFRLQQRVSKLDHAGLVSLLLATKRHKKLKKSAEPICAFCASLWLRDF